MNVLDVIIVVAAIGYGIGGFRHGAVVGLLSLVGFFTGAIVGAQLAGPVGSHVASGRARVPVALVCVLVVAMIGQFLGVFIAGRIKARWLRNRGRFLDAAVGAALGIVAVLLVAWMVAVPLASSPYPALASAASHSKIVRGVDQVMPQSVRTLYSSLRTFLDQSGFPPVFGDLPSTPIVSVPAPSPALPSAVGRRLRAERASIVKVYGQAPSCARAIEGSGFVYAPHRVMTNAHVVAGTRTVAVQLASGPTPARVVVYDPQRDVAVLAVPGLSARPLRFAGRAGASGDPAVVVGYPEDGPFTVRTARIRSRLTVSGRDIYGTGNVQREVYSVRAVVRSGNSGGPLLNDSGRVLGVVFATALDDADTGFALTAGEVRGDAARGRSAHAAVGTGRCTPD
jgi:S1-C subfamily serine protease